MTMPILFVGHGNPLNAIEDNEITMNWRSIVKSIPTPKAICCISAHWQTDGTTAITAMRKPRTIHDFYGFPKNLFEVQYSAIGDPKLAAQISNQLETKYSFELNESWGLDHGTWSVLNHMYPNADIPVLQLSIEQNRSADFYFNLGADLQFLRDQNILLIGSGNIVHNLGLIKWNDFAFDWAIEFDAQIAELIDNKNYEQLVNYQNLTHNQLAIPTSEHYLPLLYILGASKETDQLHWFNPICTNGSISMRSILLH